MLAGTCERSTCCHFNLRSRLHVADQAAGRLAANGCRTDVPGGDNPEASRLLTLWFIVVH
jgi:hypothetical protein